MFNIGTCISTTEHVHFQEQMICCKSSKTKKKNNNQNIKNWHPYINIILIIRTKLRINEAKNELSNSKIDFW